MFVWLLTSIVPNHKHDWNKTPRNSWGLTQPLGEVPPPETFRIATEETEGIESAAGEPAVDIEAVRYRMV